MDKEDRNQKGFVVQLLAILFSLVAAWLSYELLMKHMTGGTTVAFFEAACTAGGDGMDSCDAALASKYAYWPPKIDDKPDEKPRIPVAFLGLIYYSSLLIWSVGIGRPDPSRRWWLFIPMAMVSVGMLMSAFFMYVMLSDKSEMCPLCVATHVLNLGLAICIFLAWPGRPKVESAAQKHGGKLRRTAEKEQIKRTLATAHPSGRLVLLTLGGMMLVTFGQDQLRQKFLFASKAAGYDRCIAAVKRFKQDIPRLLKNWDSQQAVDLQLTDADPLLPAEHEGPVLTCVIFSDFECTSCSRIGKMLKEEVRPMFGGQFRIYYKHFPLDPNCNPNITASATHQHACLAGRLAEAARLQGGDAMFWKAYDEIYSRQQPKAGLAALDPADVGKALQLDVGKLLTDMESPEVAGRIEAGIELAHRLGLGRTPVVFVNGKQVDTFAVTELDFWDRLADSYWGTLRQKRPEHTKRKRGK